MSEVKHDNSLLQRLDSRNIVSLQVKTRKPREGWTNSGVTANMAKH